MFGFWDNSWLFGQFFVDFWPLVRFLAFGKIFDFLDDFWLFGQFLSFELIFWLLRYCLASGSILGYSVDFLSISGLCFDVWIVGRFLAFCMIFCLSDDVFI